jgi:hypothetical protein
MKKAVRVGLERGAAAPRSLLCRICVEWRVGCAPAEERTPRLWAGLWQPAGGLSGTGTGGGPQGLPGSEARTLPVVIRRCGSQALEQGKESTGLSAGCPLIFPTFFSPFRLLLLCYFKWDIVGGRPTLSGYFVQPQKKCCWRTSWPLLLGGCKIQEICGE